MRLSTGTTAGSGAFFSIDPRTGKIVISTTGGGKINIVLDSKIMDETDNPIAYFAQTCEEADDAWLRTLAAAGVTVP